MEWIILFVASWILFLVLVDWKTFHVNLWCGVVAIALQLAIDSQAMSRGLYKIENPVISIIGSSAFFVLGPVFVVATLFAQYHPQKRWMKIVNVFIIAGLFSIDELLILLRKALLYPNWHYVDSVVVNIVAITALSWFSIVALAKGRSVNEK